MSAGYKDFTAGAILTAADLEDYNQNQSIMRFASAAARDAALTTVKTEGMMAYLIDLNVMTVYSGSAWSTIGSVHGALTVWTPTITQSAGVTFTTTFAHYVRMGRWIIGWFNLAVTGPGTAANAIIIGGIPTTAAAAMVGTMLGAGELLDASAATKYGFNVALESATTFSLRQQPTTAQTDNRYGISGTVFGLALASGDNITGCFQYEASADG